MPPAGNIHGVGRTRAAIFALLYTGAILYLTLFPLEFQFFARGQQLQWVPISGRRILLDAYLNLMFFAPLGASLCLALGGRWWSAILAFGSASLLSYTIEWLQLWTPHRYANLTDWAANSAGAVVGAAAAWWAVRWWPRSWVRARAHRWSLQPQQMLLALLWTLARTWPFVPAIRLSLIQQFTSFNWSFSLFAAYFLMGTALRSALAGSPWLFLLLAMVPTQAFLVDHGFSYAAMFGALLGAAAFAAVPRLAGLLPWALSLWVVHEEFRPYQWTDSPQSFAWMPFTSWSQAPNEGYYTTVLGKLFLYTLTVWAWRDNQRSWAWSIAVPGVILAAGEWTQRYLPGRTPETTDLALLLAGALLLALCPARAAR